MKNVVVAALVALVLACTGCIRQPAMKLHGARITQATTTGVEMAMTMEVRNDNDFDVMVRAVRADVVLARGLRLPAVSVAPDVWLPADRSTLVVVPVTVPWQSVPQLVQITLGSQTIAYQARGSADVSATRALAIDVDDYAFEQDGVVRRDELVAAASRSLLGGFLVR